MMNIPYSATQKYIVSLVVALLLVTLPGATLFPGEINDAGASATLNEAPDPPFNLNVQSTGSAITLSWGFGLDAETFFTDLGYDLRVGTTPGGSDIVAPTGEGPGNRGNAREASLDNLGSGTYYWSVQAVDAEFARSAFATEQVFSIQDDEFTYVPLFDDERGKGVWLDYDNDGDLDILFAGSDFTQTTLFPLEIFRNDGGKFTRTSTNLPSVNNWNVDLADYDNDNDLDVLLMGSTGPTPDARFAKLFENKSGSFSDTGVDAGTSFFCSITSLDRILVDVDNNGFVDLVSAWEPGGFSGVIGVRKNTGGAFEGSYASWADASSSGTLVPGDYDKDGQIDVFANGLDNSACKGPVSSLRRNTGSAFEFINTDITTGFNGRPAWGDYDADGDLDLITSGALFGGLGPGFNADFSGVYRNDGGVFNLAAELLPSSTGQPAWGDYDMDGDLDVILPGQGSAALFENREGTFVNIAGAFDGILVSSAMWGDYDGDDDLDALVYGTLNNEPVARIYSNTRLAKNDAPAAPQNLSAAVIDNGVNFGWSETGDEETPSRGLTYNLRVGTTPGGSEAFSANALNDGTLLEPAMGNVFHRTTWTLRGLPEGTYYWSVQAVDGGFMGSPFSEEKTITVGGGGPVDDFTASSVDVVDVDEGDAEWADYDNDGDLDLLLTGTGASGAVTKLYTNTGNTLVDSGMAFENLDLSDAAWSDVDLDGDLDFVLTGRGSGDSHNTVLYINQGASFEARNNVFPGVLEGAVDWGDYDNDGDPDLLLTGLTSGLDNIARVFRNDQGSWTDIDAGLVGIRRGDIAWVDYDVDGDQDILITGRIDNVINRRSVLYNNNEGLFTNVNDGLPDADLSGVDWGDYDQDGDPDLLITGTTGSQFITSIFRNDGGTLVNINAGLTGSEFSDVQWGDYDNDGDLDVLMSGAISGGRKTEVYRNDGGFFTDSDAGMTDVSKSSVAWADYDGDGDLDAFVTGQTSDNNRAATLYTNNASSSNTPPESPAETWVNIGLETVTLNWDNGSDNETATAGLSYNLRIGTTPGGEEIVSPHALSSGERKVVRRGNVGQRNSWAIRLLKAGTYYWSVQSIDGAYAGSPFSFEQSFTLLDDLLPVELTAFTGTNTGGKILLEWETANETNNAGFSIERSTDGAVFHAIAFVEGNGTVSQASSYSYTDTALPFTAGDLFYRLKQIDFDGQFAYAPVVSVSLDLPVQAALWPNYPNPFNPSTAIRYEIPVAGHVHLAVYDATGKEVAVLVDEVREAGRYDARFDGASLASGVYFYRLETATTRIMKQMILLK